MTEAPPPAGEAGNTPDASVPDALRSALADRYDVRGRVGEGGSSTVYEAHDRELGRVVALKVLHPELSSAVGAKRFAREIRIGGKLDHDGILPVLDSGDAAGSVYYTMPLVRGRSLRERLASEGQLPLDEAIRIAGDVADALEHAHASGIVHRDIKPGNILLADGRAVVADFGIAHALAAEEEALTRSGIALGTPAYMSPEQTTGETTSSPRVDVYALGCVVYEMLAGDPPFTGRTAQAILARQLAEAPSSLRIVRPAVPPAVDYAIEKSLAKVPADRFATVADFKDALVTGAEAPWREPRPARRRWVAAAAVAGVAALAGWWGLVATAAPDLDRARIVVYPLVDAAGTADRRGGEGVAGIIGYVLDDTEPLRWVEGWHLLGADQRDARSLQLDDAAALARASGAAFFTMGRIVESVDSLTVLLSLHAADGAATLAQAGATGVRELGIETRLAVRAVADLLPDLLEPGSFVEHEALSERTPAALANFYQGENEYRRGHFTEALAHYERALDQDSALAIGWLRAAEAATWLESLDQAAAFVARARERPSLLPDPYVALADGLQLYLAGSADSAVVRLDAALTARPQWVSALALLGEVYTHLVPRVDDPDARARDAFGGAHRLDPDFTPAVVHLAWDGTLRGDLETARGHLDRLRAQEFEAGTLRRLTAAVACADQGAGSDAWSAAAAAATSAELLQLGFTLTGGGRHLGCAAAALRSVIAAPDAPGGRRWAAELTLEAVLLARGDLEEARTARAEAGAWSRTVAYHPLLWGAAGWDFDEAAEEMIADLWPRIDELDTRRLWLLGIWDVTRGDGTRIARVAEMAMRRAEDTGAEGDLRLARALEGHRAYHEGRLDEAAALLSGLEHTVDLAAAWDFWITLEPERLALARIRLEQGDAHGAAAAAREVDHVYPRSAIAPAFLRASLRVQADAAEALGDEEGARALRRRIDELPKDPPDTSTRSDR